MAIEHLVEVKVVAMDALESSHAETVPQNECRKTHNTSKNKLVVLSMKKGNYHLLCKQESSDLAVQLCCKHFCVRCNVCGVCTIHLFLYIAHFEMIHQGQLSIIGKCFPPNGTGVAQNPNN